MLIAKMYIKYVIDGDIEPVLKQFQDNGMYACVRTYDPNIDEKMIEKKVNLKELPLKVIRYKKEDEVSAVSNRVNSGLVTFGAPKSLLQVLPYCDKVIHTKKTCATLSVMAIIISLILYRLILASGGSENINSLYIAAYQVAWMIPTYLASKIFIR